MKASIFSAIILLAGLAMPSAARAQNPWTQNSLNARVLAFAQQNLGRQVGNGQCAVLPYEALRANGGWHGQAGNYVWGRRVTGQVLPGDIVQFENCRFHGPGYWMSMPHHTAIIQAQESPGVYRILQSNIGGDLRVQQGRINLWHRRQGTITIYRPVPMQSRQSYYRR